MDPDHLRIILALCGALVLAGLYLWERRRHGPDDEDREADDSQPQGEEGQDSNREPNLGTWENYDPGPDGSTAQVSGSATEPAGQEGGVPPAFELEPPPAPPKGAPPEFPPGPLLLTLHVVSRGDPFEGAAVVHAAGHCGLEPGDMDIFHCSLGDDDHCETLFSMASMVKPGTFPFGAMAEFRTPGLTLFAELDGTHEDPGRMEELLGTAHSLAEDLNGEIRDGKRGPFTEEEERRLRERVMAFVEVRLAANPA